MMIAQRVADTNIIRCSSSNQSLRTLVLSLIPSNEGNKILRVTPYEVVLPVSYAKYCFLGFGQFSTGYTPSLTVCCPFKKKTKDCRKPIPGIINFRCNVATIFFPAHCMGLKHSLLNFMGTVPVQCWPANRPILLNCHPHRTVCLLHARPAAQTEQPQLSSSVMDTNQGCRLFT